VKKTKIMSQVSNDVLDFPSEKPSSTWIRERKRREIHTPEGRKERRNEACRAQKLMAASAIGE